MGVESRGCPSILLCLGVILVLGPRIANAFIHIEDKRFVDEGCQELTWVGANV